MRVLSGCAAVCIAVLAAQFAPAQTSPPAGMQQQIDELRAEVKALESELNQVKATLREQTARANPVFDTTGYPSRGETASRVVIIEFSDFQCPYCLEYFKTAYPQVVSTYVNSGKVRYVFADFPGENIHPDALKAAIAGRCAAEQGKFWEMHDQLFQHQRELAGTGIADSTHAAGLDGARLDACMGKKDLTVGVRATIQTVSALGLRGTPAIVLGVPDPQNPMKVKLARAFIGAQPFAVYQQAIDALLSK